MWTCAIYRGIPDSDNNPFCKQRQRCVAYFVLFYGLLPFCKLIYENVRKMLPDLHRPSSANIMLHANRYTHVCEWLCVCVSQLLLLFVSWVALGLGGGAYAQRGAYETGPPDTILQQIPNARHEQLLNFAKHTHIICLNSADVSVGLCLYVCVWFAL